MDNLTKKLDNKELSKRLIDNISRKFQKVSYMGREFYARPTKETYEQNLRNYKEIPLEDHKHLFPIN